MSRYRTRKSLAALLLALAGACGGAAQDQQAATPANADGSDAPGADKNVASGKPASLETLRKKLRSLKGAKRLELAAQGWGAELGRLLGSSDTLAQVEALDVSDNDLGPDGATALLASSQLSTLTELDLGGNAISDAGTLALAFGKLGALVTLNLSGNGIGPDGAKAFAKSKNYPTLVSLDLSMNAIGADGVRALGNVRASKLASLFLLGCEIGAEGAKAIAKASSWKLDVLALSGNSIGDAGAKALAGSAKLASLSTLDLSTNNIGDAGAKALANSPHLKGLHSLEMFANDLGPAGKAALAKRFGKAVRL